MQTHTSPHTRASPLHTHTRVPAVLTPGCLSHIVVACGEADACRSPPRPSASVHIGADSASSLQHGDRGETCFFFFFFFFSSTSCTGDALSPDLAGGKKKVSPSLTAPCGFCHNRICLYFPHLNAFSVAVITVYFALVEVRGCN